MEGLVKAGAFDCIKNNRRALLNSIPNIILKSKNLFENKLINQINLFNDESVNENDFLNDQEEWNNDEKLSKEFETLGFYISDHPLNQYRSIFSKYNIISYDDFNQKSDILSSNVACTILKVQEKKTSKGNSYAIVKFSDLSSVFELFIFSDLFLTNREILVEGNSLMITLIKNISDEETRQRKINVKKIIPLKDVVNKPINEVIIQINNMKDLEKIKKLSSKDGKTKVSIKYKDKDKILHFELSKLRNLDHNSLNLLQIDGNIELN